MQKHTVCLFYMFVYRFLFLKCFRKITFTFFTLQFYNFSRYNLIYACYTEGIVCYRLLKSCYKVMFRLLHHYFNILHFK